MLDTEKGFPLAMEFACRRADHQQNPLTSLLQQCRDSCHIPQLIEQSRQGEMAAGPNFYKLKFAQPWLSERIKEGSTQ